MRPAAKWWRRRRRPGARSAACRCRGRICASQADWLAADIEAGLPLVTAATTEQFIPQMLNLDLLEAVSFTKGCYTGQEIVARTHHLGRVKRRAMRFRLPPGPAPEPLQNLLLDGAKAADVLLTASTPDGIELLAVTNLDAQGSGPDDRKTGASPSRCRLPTPGQCRTS